MPKSHRIAGVPAWLVMMFAGLQTLPAAGTVKMWEEPVVIPTYHVGPPEANPVFYSGRSYQGAKGPVYPYPLYSELTDEKSDKTYKAVYLENEYVQISVLPEIGGRIFTGVDKTNNYDFFYRQHVIKPALIGMIGAWISGGVEWNIPHHHRASTFLTVDYTLIAEPDGSKTIWIGEMELRHRMRWIVGLTLRPGKSYIEATIKLFNRTPLAHSMLYFANVAVHANPDYQVIFPPSTEFGTQHAKREFIEWPIAHSRYAGMDHDGIDVSWWKNHPKPLSIFAWNYQDDFFGGYDHGRRAGVACVADHHIAPGKKFFEFANGDQGRMWDKILTDTDGPYLELMAGAYSDNQPDYSWVQPHEVKIIKQYWYPIRELGGIKNANLDAAVNLEVDKSNVASFGFNTTSGHENATVRLKAGDRVLFEQKLTIGPEKPFRKSIALGDDVRQEDLTAALYSSKGRQLVSYTPVKPEGAPMPEPVRQPPAPNDIKTNEQLYLAGLRLEQFYSPALEPYPYYEEALKRDPGDYRVNTALGILYCKRGMFKEAQEKLEKAIERATKNYTRPKDTEAYYYLGLALRAQGKLDAATDAFQRAAWSYAWYAAANYSLAEIACREDNLAQAMTFIDRSIATNHYNSRALNLKTVLLRKSGKLNEAQSLAADVLEADPLNFWAANELYLVSIEKKRRAAAQKGLEDLQTRMRGEVQSYLELAIDYGNCGFSDEAIEVLERFVATAPEKDGIHPMVHYYLGYYWEKKADPLKARRNYGLAAKMPPDYCFPFRWESREVLESAIRHNPKDARAPYYLGNLLYDHQPENAILAWEQSRALEDGYSIVHRNLGLAYAQVHNDAEKAVAALERAVACNPADPRLYAELDDLYETARVSHEKRLALLKENHATVLKFDSALKREIKLLTLVGQYDRAIEIMDNHHFHLWEGETGVHSLYVDAHLLRGGKNFEAGDYRAALKDYEACLEYPDRFETGRPYGGGGKLPQINYSIATAHEAMGESAKAHDYFELAAEARVNWPEIRYYQGLAFLKLDRKTKADEIFEGLIRDGRKRLETQAGIDFFAKFGGRESEAARKAGAHYLVGLGLLGKGETEDAKHQFQKAHELDINHLGAQTHLKALE